MTTELSETPETDNLARGNHVVPTEWAEKLERERDEAREKNARLREIISRANRDYDEQIELFRAEGNKLRDIAERAAWRMVAGAEVERDESRGEAVRYRSLYYQTLGIDRSASWFPWEAKP
jgi:hypothetical protein